MNELALLLAPAGGRLAVDCHTGRRRTAQQETETRPLPRTPLSSRPRPFSDDQGRRIEPYLPMGENSRGEGQAGEVSGRASYAARAASMCVKCVMLHSNRGAVASRRVLPIGVSS